MENITWREMRVKIIDIYAFGFKHDAKNYKEFRLECVATQFGEFVDTLRLVFDKDEKKEYFLRFQKTGGIEVSTRDLLDSNFKIFSGYKIVSHMKVIDAVSDELYGGRTVVVVYGAGERHLCFVGMKEKTGEFYVLPLYQNLYAIQINLPQDFTGMHAVMGVPDV